jgi:hypothetical protein
MCRFAMLLVVAASLLFLHGCGPSGVGSVDWADNPNARAVGAPPRSPSKPVETGKPRGSKKTGEFIPG